ncbi:CAP domain-containing protein [Chelatococcus sp. SYSU_G07232]|uniref:CAP domain-containing protein n=1 Tax=Chelatococcus albus TaxID=3047466 RepID=A0ABT7ADH9_9HYPH|nr:CAP domain-containing protein [Chelatococcus sp. SYSU_G07232]MDJ1157414.1 CAP domain-containing protein [Chelatococcus sp. SYSU_G07232]
MPRTRDVAARIALVGALTALAACTEERVAEKPRFYQSLAAPGAAVDSASAAGMISAYRRNHGLAPLALDETLQGVAAAEAEAMAAADRPASADTLKAKLAAAGVAGASANISAGYHTLAEAFSGWRDSPAHNRVMLDPAATRMGIATAFAPGSKYKVYWVLAVAAPAAR